MRPEPFQMGPWRFGSRRAAVVEVRVALMDVAPMVAIEGRVRQMIDAMIGTSPHEMEVRGRGVRSVMLLNTLRNSLVVNHVDGGRVVIDVVKCVNGRDPIQSRTEPPVHADRINGLPVPMKKTRRCTDCGALPFVEQFADHRAECRGMTYDYGARRSYEVVG